MSKLTLWHHSQSGPGHFRLQNLSFSAHDQFSSHRSAYRASKKLLMTKGRRSCEGMVQGPCLSSVSESVRVDSYAVSIRSLKSYSDHSYVDLKIMFFMVHISSTWYRAKVSKGNRVGFLLLYGVGFYVFCFCFSSKT